MSIDGAARQRSPELKDKSATLTSHRRGRDALDRQLAVSVEEAAGLLGISRSFAYELVRRGELRAVRLSRRLVVPVVSLEAVIGIDAVGESIEEVSPC